MNSKGHHANEHLHEPPAQLYVSDVAIPELSTGAEPQLFCSSAAVAVCAKKRGGCDGSPLFLERKMLLYKDVADQ